MAKKEVIFEADIKIDEAIKAQQDLTAEIEKQKKKLDELKQSNTDNSEAVIKQTALIKVLVKEQKANEAQLQAVIKSNIKATGSIDQLSAELSVVTKQWNALSEEERENTEEGRALTQQKTELTKKLSELRQATGDSRMEVGKYKDTTVSLKLELRENIKALAQMKAAGEDNTEAYQKLLKTTGELQDTIADTREEVKRYASDTQTLDMAIGVFNGIGSAAQIAEGASALLGDENENLTKSIQKMVAIQSIMNGLQEIQNALQKESAFMMGLNTVKTKAMAAAQAIYTTAVGTSTGAMKLFRIALLGTGIGAIAVAIGLLISNWDELTGSVNESKKAIDGTRIANDELRDSYNEHIKIIRDLKIEYDLLSGKITDQEAEVQKLKNEYGDALVTIENETSEKLSKAGGYWNNLKLSLKSLGSTYGLLSLQAKQNAEILTEQAVKSAHENEKYLLKKKLADEKAAQDASKLSQKEKDEAEKKRKDELAAYEKYLNEKYQKDVDYYVAKANEDINRQYQEQESEAIQQQAISDMLKAERQKRREQKDIDRQLELESMAVDFENELILLEQYGASEIEIQKIKLEQQRQEEIANAERIGADVTLINEKYRQQDLELERMKVDAKLALASNFMSGISQLFDQGTAVGKAAAVADTLINTYRGAQAAFAQTPGGIGIKVGAAALATALGLKNVQKILATKKGSTGSAGNETASAPIANAVNPSVSMGAVSGAVGTSTGQMVTNAVDSSAKTQIAVVVDDVTAKQNQQTNANKLATL